MNEYRNYPEIVKEGDQIKRLGMSPDKACDVWLELQKEYTDLERLGPMAESKVKLFEVLTERLFWDANLICAITPKDEVNS